MAAVYAATHRNGNRVAIKVLHRAYAEIEDAKSRFLREGYVANKVGHDNAVTVLDDDELSDGTPFLVMELLEGVALQDRMAQMGVMPVGEMLYIGDQILDVLAAAHQREIIHRDIKPANIYLTKSGQVKVLDFGLARVRESNEVSMTRTGTVIGTTSYMSPEQARGRRDMVDHRTDIFAVGAVLFTALAGRTVHLAQTPMDRLLAAMKEHAPSFAAVVPDAHPDLVALIDGALAFQKDERWPDARAMQDALRKVYQYIGSAPLPAAGPEPQASWTADQPEGRPGPADPDDIHVSVVFEEAGTGDSVFIEIEDDGGQSKRLELRPSGERRDGALPEVNVFELDEPGDM